MGKKRGDNTGSVFKRPRNGQWVGKVTLGYKDGRRVRKEFTGQTQREVLQRMADAKATAEADLSTSKDIKNLTVSQYLDYWITDIVGKDKFVLSPRKARTKHDYKDICRLHLKPQLGHIKLVNLDLSDIEGMLDDLQAREFSPRRRQYIHTVLRLALNNAISAKLLRGNPARDTHVPVQRKKVNPFSYEEANRLLKAVEGHRLEALFILAITSGARQGEMLGLTWADIDLNNGMLKITRNLKYVGSKREGGFKWVFGTPKTDRSNRVLWLPDETKTALLAHRKRQAIEKETATKWGMWEGSTTKKSEDGTSYAVYPTFEWEDGTSYTLPDELVFSTERGGPIYNTILTHVNDELVASAHLRHSNFHNLRHATASYWGEQGVPIEIISGFLGHSSIAVTADYYRHLMPGESKKAAMGMSNSPLFKTPVEEKVADNA